MLTVLMLVALLAPPRPVSAAAQLQALERTWLAAAVHRDRATLDRLLADNFIDISYRGERRTKADALQSPAAPPGSTQSLSNLDVRLYGTTGIVTGVNTVTIAGRQPVRLRFTDVFVRMPEGWRAVSAQETLEAPGRAPR